MTRFEILSGLPPYGPMALPFPPDGRQAFTEGLVVRFWPENKKAWIGNFQRSSVMGYDAVLAHPDGRQIMVVAGGAGYVVDSETRCETQRDLSSDIVSARCLPELGIILFEDGLRFAALKAGGEAWASDQIAWDEIRNISIEGACLRAEAYSPLGDRWHPFSLDLNTGECANVVYQAEMGTAIQLR